MAILVTGGLGFVGSHFVRAAPAVGGGVVGLPSRPPTSPSVLPPGTIMARGDIADEAQIASLCREHRVDGVVHFAGKIQVGESVRRPDIYFDVNVSRSLRLLEAVRAAGVTRFVFSSTAAVYGEPVAVPIPEAAARRPVNPYGATKLALEFALEAYGVAYGLRWAALRYFNAAGAHPDGTMRESHEPETHLIPLAIDAALGTRAPLTLFGTDYPTPDGTCVRDYVHVCDLADAHLRALALLSKGVAVGALNLGTGQGCSVREVIEATLAVTGKAVPFSVSARRDGDPPSLIADPSAARSLLGWSPRRAELAVILEDTLRSRLGR
jgi:UDP-glucose-4-epimerase GalE